MADYEKVSVKRTRLQLGGSTTVDSVKFLPYKNQDYEKLRKECLDTKRLFEDPLFPAIDTSISYTRSPPFGTKWKRPSEIVKATTKPLFIQDEAHCGDLDQGSLGNCWFIAGCSGISLVPTLFKRVVPMDQVLVGDDYAGIFHFRFWIYGDWCDVVIDDRLPVTSTNELLFCRNKQQPNEFWSALLEKAYAKVCLSYENLDGGFTTDALIDMSGGIEESFKIKTMQNESERNRMWQIIVKSRQHQSLIGCSIAPNPRVREARMYNGLVMGHAYIVTKVACIERYGREIRLVRVRNPWGNEVEWRGSWSDTSYDWSTLSYEVKQQLGYRQMPDGEFWMAYDDFYRNFETIEFCNLTPDALSSELDVDNNARITWKLVSYHGEWVRDKSAGGCGKPNERAFWTNPQFLITLKDVDPNDNENLATVIISLMQKGTREKRMKHNGEAAEEFIQFRLFKVTKPADAENARKTGIRLYANQLEKVGTSGSYTNLRDLTRRFRVPPGDYMIIPSCYDEGAEGQFLLRLFTEVELMDSQVAVLEDSKDDLQPEDVFFTPGKHINNLFNNWSSLISGGGSSKDLRDGTQVTDTTRLRASYLSASVDDIRENRIEEDSFEKTVVIRRNIRHRTAKEACNVM